MRIPKLLFLALTVLLMDSIALRFADTDAEHAALEQIVAEIEALDELIDRAEREAEPNARIKFQYDWLRRDLKLVRRGIEDHLDAPSSAPREFEPIQGDYRQ